MAADELQQIARARVNMMLRGYEPLRLELGRQFSEDVMRQLGPSRYTEPHLKMPRPPATILSMPYTVRTDMEGFAVLHG